MVAENGIADAVSLGVDPQGLEAKDKRDASTETPVHFVEKHIDYSYDWNEWQLRRKALQVVNLRKCRTVSQQTDASHFRR